MRRIRRLTRRGMALVVTILLIPIMVVLGFCITQASAQNCFLSTGAEQGKRAEYVAEAGARAALERLKDGTGNYGPLWGGTFTYTVTTPTQYVQDRLTNSSGGQATQTATVTIWNNTPGAPAGTGSSQPAASATQGGTASSGWTSGNANVYTSNGAAVPVNSPDYTAYILSTCSLSNGRITRSTGALVHLHQVTTGNPFNQYKNDAVASQAGVTDSGNGATDAYDSSLGPYGANIAGVLNKNQVDGGLLTNGTSHGIVSLTGNANIGGNVSIGQGGTTSSAISTSGSAQYDGSASSQSTNAAFTAVTVPASITSGGYTSTYTGGTTTLSPGYYGNVQLSGQNVLTLQAGTYVFDSLSLSGQSQLVTPAVGKVTIYITHGGTLDLSGGSVANTGGLPKNLEFFIAGSGTVKVSGNGQPYFAVYAPQADVKISGNGDIYGMVVGKTVDISGNGNIHNDIQVALDNSGSTITYAVVTGNPFDSWQRF